jgi:cytosine/uracil/thiamine/allantoin permease
LVRILPLEQLTLRLTDADPPAFVVAGIVVSSGAQVIYGGELEWNPLILIDNFGDDGKGRAARFFCAFSFAFATIGTNVSANSISAANDLCALFPRWFNVRPPPPSPCSLD